MNFHRIRHVAEIGDNSHLNPLRAEAEAHRIDGIVGNGERIDFELPNRHSCARLERLNDRLTALPVDCWGGFVGEVDRNLRLLVHRDTEQSGDMVAVFVRDEDRVELVDVLPDGGEPLPGLQPAETGVDEDARAVRADKGGVPGTA